jgi:hypothetical protein
MDVCLYCCLSFVVGGLYLYFVTWPRVRARDEAYWRDVADVRWPDSR